MTNDEFQIVRDTAAESVQGRIVRGAVRAVAAAWTDSRVRRLAAAGIAASSGSANATSRARYGAIAVIVATAVNVAILSIAPVYAAPGIPRAVIVLIGIVAAAVAIAPEPFATAWPQSQGGRLWRRLSAYLQNSAE